MRPLHETPMEGASHICSGFACAPAVRRPPLLAADPFQSLPAGEANSRFAAVARHASFPRMRFHIFFSGLTILAMGGVAMSLLEKADALGFLTGAMQLGGGIVICGLFSLKMRWHGFIGAGILALLGAARGLGNVPGLVKFMTGDRPHGPAPLLEAGVTLVCVLLLMRIIRALHQERVRRMLEAGE
jgi:hypothetical protein